MSPREITGGGSRATPTRLDRSVSHAKVVDQDHDDDGRHREVEALGIGVGTQGRVERVVGKRGEGHAAEDDRLATNLVREPAPEDERRGGDQESDSDNPARRQHIELLDRLEVKQRPELAAVPDAPLPQHDHAGDNHVFEVAAHEGLAPRIGRRSALGLDLLEDRRFAQREPDPDGNGDQEERDDERQAPAPVVESLDAQIAANPDDDRERYDDAERRRRLEPAGVVAAMLVLDVLGAITYVAEHIEDEHRGYYTGWLQTSPTLGIVVSLAIIIGIRSYLGVEAFNDWGWRLPFIISLLLVAIAIWIRLSLGETPIFQEIKAKGRTATNPWREAFMSSNFKYVVIASVVVLGQGCVWYSGQFWALFYLQSVKKLDVLTSSWIIAIALLIATPTLIFWGWLSDKIGRKPIILGGMALASLTYYPLYSALGNYADPTNVNYPMSILIVVILVNYVGMTYGPIGAFLAEFFPSRIRYTSVSVPYHIGNGWGGGLVPIITTAAYAKAVETGSSDPLFWSLVYPIALPAIMFLIAIFVMPETRKHSIWEDGAIEASRSRA